MDFKARSVPDGAVPERRAGDSPEAYRGSPCVLGDYLVRKSTVEITAMTVEIGPRKYMVWINRVYLFGILVAVIGIVVGALIR